MGTRHLICVVSDGEYRIAQYGQWDGYPSGQGVSILEFLQGDKVELLKEKIHNCTWITGEELKNRWLEFGVDLDKQKFITYDVSNKFCTKYPELSRDTGAEILELVADSQCGLCLRNDHDFAYDSVFCEWAYVIDFDKQTFEVYKGFNNTPIDKNERFYTENLVKYSTEEVYYPVKIIATYLLSKLPSEEDFIQQCESSEENE